ncbi:MAG: hypothetical protein FJY97_12110 [candidate division Zixibacteria bacterium]|nr:hypothetical protein [candidate division Zixibacteria bacterium]
MRMRFFLLCGVMLSLVGCGAYSELKPKPVPVSAEGQYIELTRSKNEKKTEWFALKKDKKYFIKFPAPTADDFYLVLKTDRKILLGTYLTSVFTKGKKPDTRIADESEKPDELVYHIDRTLPFSFWVIETVSENMILQMQYRYTPVWRYKFETRHAASVERLERNRIDRTLYRTLGDSFHFSGFDFAREMGALAGTLKNQKTLETELRDLEALFPPELVGSEDPAYQNFVTLRDGLREEIRFQEDYKEVLSVFRTEEETSRDMGAFLNASPRFNTFLTQKDRFPTPILAEARTVLGRLLGDVVPYLEQQVARKDEVSPIRFGFELADVETLYRNTGQAPPQTFKNFSVFVSAYNGEAIRLAPAQARLSEAVRYAAPEFTWPSVNHYNEALKHIAELNRIMPEQRSASYQAYDRFTCVTLLNREVGRIRSDAVRWGRDYAAAQGVVEQVNALRPQHAYRPIIQVLSAYKRLDFLMEQYPDVDQLSVDQQQTGILAVLESRNWPDTENRLRELHIDTAFLRLDRIAPVRRAVVERLEERLATGIEQTSKGRVDAFVAVNRLTIDRVEALYADSVFLPVHVMSFTSGTPDQLAKRNVDVKAYLDNLKYNGFPGSAIPELYRELTRNPKDRGVDKARAVVIHGKYYKGDDRQIRNLIAECDPTAPKWITKPTEYRKVYALPVTTNPKGENQYLLRLNIRIPTEAKFPVFDINLRLPKEIAGKALYRQWYDHVLLNKTALKTEGRFTITAPTAENGYEAQFTPVQMRADENNVLEIQFTHPSFQVFGISAMSQRPILRKD